MKKLSACKWMALLPAAALAGCSGLNAIHGYTSAAVDGTAEFSAVDYSFQQSCLDRCRLEAMQNFSVQRDTGCACTLYVRADSVTHLIYHAVAGYLNELNALSSKDLTTYNLDALQTAVSYQDFAPLHLTDQQVNAYTALTRLLLHATDLHRMKELRQFIAKANPSFQTLIKAFQFILKQNLNGELNFKKESLFAYYKALSLGTQLSDYDKGRLVEDYYNKLSPIRLKQKQIAVLDETLSQVAAGHQQMADHIHEWSSTKIKSQLMQSTVNIQSLTSAFDALK